MIGGYCIPKEDIDKLKTKFKSMGSDFGNQLVDMSPADRLKLFSDTIGNKKDGEFLAVSFEKAMASKQANGLVNWAKKIFTEKEQKSPEFFSVVKKIQDLNNRGVFNPDEAGNYLDNLISSTLKVGVSTDEIFAIKQHSDYITLTKDNLLKNNTEENRIAYGQSIIDMYDYVQSIAPKKTNIVQNLANLPKTLMASGDFSAPFRQGLGMVSRPQFWNALGDMFRVAFNKDEYRKLKADIISRPSYPLMKKAGLRLSVLADNLSQREDNFMSTLVEKIPGVGNVLQGSERAFAGFLSKVRADVFDDLIKNAKLAGENVEMGSEAVRDIAKVVNDFTGSGNIGKNDRFQGAVPFLNVGLFSPRKIAATINMFNPQRYFDPRISKTARIAAARNLVGMIGMSVTLLSLYNLIAPEDDKPETDPRSSDFGKLKIGNSRIDVTGGNSSYANLLARIFTNSTKSSTSGDITELGSGYGTDTRFDVSTNFIKNKFSPLIGYVAKFMDQQEGDEQGFDAVKDTTNLVTPMTIQTFIESAKTNDGWDEAFISTLADIFGFGANSYNK